MTFREQIVRAGPQSKVPQPAPHDHDGSDLSGDATFAHLKVSNLTGGTIISEEIVLGGSLILSGGGRIATANTGQRVQLDAGGTDGLQFFTGSAQELHHGYIYAIPSGSGATETLPLVLVSPAISVDGSAVDVQTALTLSSESEDETTLPPQVSLGVLGTPHVTPPEFKMTDSFKLMLEDGGIADPGVAFNNAASSGLYKIASSQDMGVAINGAAVARFGDGFIGPLTTWSPSWTNLSVGNGTLNWARYCQIGDFVFADLQFTFGSTTSISGDVSVSAPVACLRNDADTNIGGAVFLDTGTTRYTGKVAATGSNFLLRALDTTGNHLAEALLSSTVPMSWATGDVIAFSVFYEAA